MKKIWILLISLVLISSIVFAAGEGNQGSGIGQTGVEPETTGQGQQVNSDQQTQNQGESQQLHTKEQVKNQINELKQEMEQKRQQLNAGSEGTSEKKQEMMLNQNQVRIAAQTLSQMESMIGSRGKEISEIAKEFDNSVQSTIRAEEKIQTRSAFSRFFAGGDKKAAEEIESEATKNQERVKELKQLKEEAECDEEVKEMIQEQIQQMEQEQTRLKELAQKEKKSKGMFGWIWK